MKLKIPVLITTFLGSILTASAQTEILNSFDTFTDIWGNGQTKRDTEAVMAANNSYENSNPVVGFQELSNVAMTKFDVSSLTPGDLVGKQVFLQVALAGFDRDIDNDGMTLGAYHLLDDIDKTAILFGPKVDFVNFTVGLDWDGNDYLAGAPFPGVALSRADVQLVDLVQVTRTFLDGTSPPGDIIGTDVSADGNWNNYTKTLSFEVTSLVKCWVSGALPNNGIAIWVDPLLPLNQPLEQVNLTTFENINATGSQGGSSPARLYIVDSSAYPVPVATGAITGPNFEVSVQSDSAYNYKLQVSNDLDPCIWVGVETLSGNGSVLTFSKPLPSTGNKDFYRVVAIAK